MTWRLTYIIEGITSLVFCIFLFIALPAGGKPYRSKWYKTRQNHPISKQLLHREKGNYITYQRRSYNKVYNILI